MSTKRKIKTERIQQSKHILDIIDLHITHCPACKSDMRYETVEVNCPILQGLHDRYDKLQHTETPRL